MLVDPTAEISESTVIGPRAVIGAGCRLESGVEVRESVLLDGCVAGIGARIERSILAAGAVVESGTALEGAVIGRNESVPAS
jgi:mannose-1-phosphate guanylyltransferase